MTTLAIKTPAAKALAAILAATALTLSASAASAATRAEKGEARLARMIEGRVAGDPVSCIATMSGSRLEVIDHVGIAYDAGRTIYVARADRPQSLDGFDTVVIERSGSQLCKQDMIRTVDLNAGFTTGIVFLGDFVPYTRPEAG